MRKFPSLIVLLVTCFLLGSCEFSCSMGEKQPEGKSKMQGEARIYNDIKATAYKARLKRAYLVFEDGTRVPDDNFIDFSQPVKLVLDVDGGWTDENGRVFLGASEKVIMEDGQVLLDSDDLFEAYTATGISPQDAKRINIKAAITVRDGAPPTSFSVQFRVWDKKGDGYIEGSYMLFSK